MEQVADTSNTSPMRYHSAVKTWLVIGLFMIFVQVVVGGITRLTGSGLSITKWEIVTGTIPPLNAVHWEEAFELYKQTPQYAQINEGMTMSEFKFIFFWEYIHRLWARLMGFVFAIPFIIFFRRKMLDPPLQKRLGIVVLLAAVVASFGWIMVASGLVNRPWVNAYKLTMHLSLALILYSYLWWTILYVLQPQKKVIHNSVLKKWIYIILGVLALQIVLGGIMSGMKAGLFYPTWPDMHGEWIPSVLINGHNWNVDNFVHYDSAPFMSALIQLLHRTTAYILSGLILWYFIRGMKMRTSPVFRTGLYLLVSMLIIQVLLGIFTLINCIGVVPVGLGVLHQAGALLLLTVTLFLAYQVTPIRN